MIADTLKLIQAAEAKADNILAQANQTVQTIEKDTYAQIDALNQATEQAITAAIAAMPQPTPLDPPKLTITVPTKAMNAAVDAIIAALHEV